MKTKQVILGAIIGLAVGLLLDGLLLINSSAWLISFLFPVILPPLVTTVIGLVLGWKRRIPALPWHAIIFIALVSLPAGFWGPTKVQEWRFRRFVDALPHYGGSERRIKEISVLGGDDPPRISVEIQTKHVDCDHLIRFYRDYLVNTGWTELEPQQVYKRDIWYKFRKGNYTANLIAFEGGSWGGMQCVRITRWYNTLFYRR